MSKEDGSLLRMAERLRSKTPQYRIVSRRSEVSQVVVLKDRGLIRALRTGVVHRTGALAQRTRAKRYAPAPAPCGRISNMVARTHQSTAAIRIRYETMKNILTAMEDREIEKRYRVTELVAKLRRLSDCLEQGKPFEIQVAGERIHVPAGAVFTIEHEREGEEEELEFQFKWRNDR